MLQTLESTESVRTTDTHHTAARRTVGSIEATLTRTVPREFVHRAAVAEVFLTGIRQLSDEQFTVTAQWPRGHSFYGSVHGRYDPLLIAETIRQVGALLSHTVFDVALTHKFLLWDLNYTALPEGLVMDSAPADLELSVTCTEIRRRGNRLAGLRYEATIRHAERIIATGGASFTTTSPEAYRRLRAARLESSTGPVIPGASVLPQLVARTSPFDVVLAPAEQAGRWQLRVNAAHPVLFDHYVDHVPGMVLLEAARQAAHAIGSQDRPVLPVTLDSTFHRYAEFDSPCWVDAEIIDGDATSPDACTVRVTGRQDGETVFTTTVGLTALNPTPMV
ncbi:ScbA/BarX family gamma-butyrolactone biosynthesis protein [Streptomyces sp. NPDC002853]